jgi:hypothetical protein
MADFSPAARDTDREAIDVSGAGPPAREPQPEQASLWEDFVDIWYAPSSVFARRATGSFWIPTLVLTLLLGGSLLANIGVLQPMMDAEFHRAMAAVLRANPQLTPEMLEQGRSFREFAAKVGAFVTVPVAIFLTGLTLWVAGKFVDATESLHAALVVAAYAYLPRVIESILAGVQGLVLDPAVLNGRYRLTLGVGRFLDPDTTSPVLLALLGHVDVFTIWVTVLLAIGLATTGRISRWRAAVAAIVVWCAGTLPGLLQALRA